MDRYPDAVLLTVSDGVLMISACFEIEEGMSEIAALYSATRSTNDSLHLDTPFAYVLEVHPDGTHSFTKVSEG